VRPVAANSLTGVPFVDLAAQHASIKRDLVDDFAAVVDGGAFTNGPEVAAFEGAFAGYCGRRRCVGVASGLDALRLGLIAAGIGDGDEVIVPASTFVATIEAVIQAGARPVLVDIDEADYNIDVDVAEAAVGPRARALIAVHLYGQMADGLALESLAARHRLLLIEDAAQASGAERDGRSAGAVGEAAAFSFYPTKPLGAMGDAGALVTDREELAAGVRALREHGQRNKYIHELVGYTSRLDTFQALVLLRKLPFLDEWNEERRALASLYTEALAGIGDLTLPAVAPRSKPAWHLYVIRTGDPVGLAGFLAERGVHTGRHYPEAIHLSAAYSSLGYSRGSFPVAETLAGEALSLPLFPGMASAQVETVVDGVRAYFDHD
jgi:dTDP-4-amino-4,6-dideoxygalactose transaminase